MISCDSNMLGNDLGAGGPDSRSLVRSQIADYLRSGTVRSISASGLGASHRWVNDRRNDATISTGVPPGDLQQTQFTGEYFGYLIAKGADANPLNANSTQTGRSRMGPCQLSGPLLRSTASRPALGPNASIRR